MRQDIRFWISESYHFRSQNCTSLRRLVMASLHPISSRDAVITPKPTLSHLKDSFAREGDKMKPCLTLNGQLHRLLWLQPKKAGACHNEFCTFCRANQLPLWSCLEPIRNCQIPAYTHNHLGMWCLFLCNGFKAIRVISSISLHLYTIHFYERKFVPVCVLNYRINFSN
jgi:hypothetical protein